MRDTRHLATMRKTHWRKEQKSKDETKGKGTVSVLFNKCKCRNGPFKCDLFREPQRTYGSELCRHLKMRMREWHKRES